MRRSSAGTVDLRVGGSLVNETLKAMRAVDFLDGCMGDACGTTRTDWAVAQIAAGSDLTILAGGDLVNRGASIGAVADALIAAKGGVRFETLQDSYLLKDVHSRGFLSGTDIVEHAITTQEATAQSLLGNLSIYAGYGVCDGGSLCKANSGSDAILNGALVSAFGDVTIAATGDIDMGAVSQEVHNSYSNWGFEGLGWGSVKQRWNDVDTRVTRIAGDTVTLSADGSILGTGTRIAAASDLLMLADKDIRFTAAQDHLYFTEKGFHVGLSFPGSAAIDAAMRGGDGDDVLNGLAGISPLTGTLARLSQSENGLAAGAAALYVGVGGLNGILGGPEQMLKNAAGNLTPQLSLSSLGLSFSSWKTENRWSESTIAELSAGGDIVMQAGVDAVLAEGTKVIAGADIAISAGRDILIAALEDYATAKSTSFGLTVNPFAFSISGSYAASNSDATTYSNARIEAGGTLSLDAGRDIGIIGGVVAGDKVKVTASRDLTIASVQDTSTYKGTSIGASIGLSPAGAPTGSLNYGSTSGTYANVYEQSGIIAGKGGFEVEVGGTVDLTAGLIISSADPALNSLKATALTWSDLINLSEAETSSYGVSLTGGVLSPSVGQPAREESSGTALSTVSPGTLTLSDQSQDLASLNRDADKANSRVEIYDIEALQAKQQDAAIISQALNMAVGDIAQQAGFAEGSPEKVALHAAAGAITALVSGGDIGLGALSGGLSEVANAVLVQALDENPDLTTEQRDAILQWGAALVGAAVGGSQGAATALDNVNHNYLTHVQLEKFAEDLKGCGGDKECENEVGETYRALSDANNAELVAAVKNGDLAALAKAYGAGDTAALYDAILNSLGPDSTASDAFVAVFNDGNEVELGNGATETFSTLAFYAIRDHVAERLVNGDIASYEDLLDLAVAEFGSSALMPNVQGALMAAFATAKKVTPKAKLCSFDGNTRVKTGRGYIAIKDIQAGLDTVWSRDELTGMSAWKPVLAHYSNPYDETVGVTIRDIETGDEQTIVSNRIHPYFVQVPRLVRPQLVSASADREAPTSSEGHIYKGAIENGAWVDAANLKPGYRLLNDDESWAEVVRVTVEAKPLKAYNLTVADFHTYFVAANDDGPPVWVHNDCFEEINFNVNRLPQEQRYAVLDTLQHIFAGTVPEGPTRIRWGIEFRNDRGDLPTRTPAGQSIRYTEYRVDPAAKGEPGGGTNRIVKGSDGRIYFTGTHYGDNPGKPFVRIK